MLLIMNYGEENVLKKLKAVQLTKTMGNAKIAMKIMKKEMDSVCQ